jgi:hypothetical protein
LQVLASLFVRRSTVYVSLLNVLLKEKHKQHHKCAYRRKGCDQDVSGTTEYAKKDAKNISGILRLSD